MNFAQLLMWWLATLTLLCRHAAASELADAPRDMTYIGYASEAQGHRVFVHTNEPVRYHLDESTPNKVVLVLINTGVRRRTNTLPLDTHFLPGPVDGVRAKVVENPSASVRVEVRLKNKTPYRVVQRDCEVALLFDRSD